LAAGVMIGEFIQQVHRNLKIPVFNVNLQSLFIKEGFNNDRDIS